jgi:serine protease SohB
MLELLSEYGLFLAKTLTLLVALVVAVAVIASLSSRARKGDRGHLDIRPLDDLIRERREALGDSLLADGEQKAARKARVKALKKRLKSGDKGPQKRLFVLNFKGDMKASAVQSLREEITTVLGQATAEDEVVVRLESPGGMVHSYGLASSQLDRLRTAGIPLTVCVDKVAASGGYMMACVADRILAAPFAYIGSIGVLAQMPNFHRLLKKHDVDFEVLTAGEYKRTLTMLGENTDKGREKFVHDLQEIHDLFKDFVRQHRRGLDIDAVATGEVWLGTRARELGLVDEVMTSDEYITSQLDSAKIFEVSYVMKKSLPEKVGFAAEETLDGVVMRWWERAQRRYFS